MNVDKRLTVIEDLLLPRLDIESIYRWLEHAPYEEGCRLIESLSEAQQDELEALAVARLGPSAIDPTKFPDEELQAIADGEMTLAQFGRRARELGLI